MVIENRIEMPKAQVINQNYNLQAQQSEFANKQAQTIALRKEINKYIDTKINEGYTRDASGNLVKTVGNTTTTIKVDEQGNVDISEKTFTPAQTIRKSTGQYEKIESDIRKLEKTLRRIEQGKTEASPYAVASFEKRLKQLYDARDNLANTGTAFYTEQIPEQIQSQTQKQDVVFSGNEVNVNGLGYSVAPSLQKEFVESKTQQQTKTNFQDQTFYVPRQVSPQETISIKPNYNFNLQSEQRKFGGTISATRVGDFVPRTMDENALGVDAVGFQQKYKSNYLVNPNVNTLNRMAQASVVGGLAQGGINLFESGKQLLTPQPVLTKAVEVGEIFNPLNYAKTGAEVVEKTGAFVLKPNAFTGSELLGTGARVSGEVAGQVVLLKGVEGVTKVATSKPLSKTDILQGTIETTPKIITESAKTKTYKDLLQKQGINENVFDTTDTLPISSATKFDYGTIDIIKDGKLTQRRINPNIVVNKVDVNPTPKGYVGTYVETGNPLIDKNLKTGDPVLMFQYKLGGELATITKEGIKQNPTGKLPLTEVTTSKIDTNVLRIEKGKEYLFKQNQITKSPSYEPNVLDLQGQEFFRVKSELSSKSNLAGAMSDAQLQSQARRPLYKNELIDKEVFARKPLQENSFQSKEIIKPLEKNIIDLEPATERTLSTKLYNKLKPEQPYIEVLEPTSKGSEVQFIKPRETQSTFTKTRGIIEDKTTLQVAYKKQLKEGKIKTEIADETTKEKLIDNSDKFDFEPGQDTSFSTRQVSSSKYANDKSFDSFKTSDATFDNFNTYSQTGNLQGYPRINERTNVFVDENFKSPLDKAQTTLPSNNFVGADIKGEVTRSGITSTFPIKIQQLNTQVGVLEKPTTLSNLKSNTELKLSTENKITPITQEDTATQPKTQLRFIQASKLSQDTIQETVQEQRQVNTLQTPVTRQTTEFKTAYDYDPRTRKITGKITLPPLPEGKTQGLFVTKAKTKGKFITLGKYQTMSEAFNRGKQFVESTASASFKVESGLGETQRPSLLPKGFSFSKSSYGTIVQQRGQRIQSQGEKLEISSKGRQVQRARATKKRMFRGLFK